MEMDDTRIDYYETSEGDRVFLQYVNGVLTQKNVLPYNRDNVVLREFYTNTIIKTDILKIDEYITTSEVKQQEYATNATVSKGTIKYSTILDTGKYNYGIKCTYTTKDDTTTYTINKFKGALVDLVALVVGATKLVQKFATPFIKAVLVAAGISIVAGVIKSALTTTISCDRRVYKWKLVDTKNTSHSKYVYGYRYKANDSKYDCNDTFYEGYLPSDWKTSALAIEFHNELFTYSVFTAEGWS